jgi:hypothetical protein
MSADASPNVSPFPPDPFVAYFEPFSLDGDEELIPKFQLPLGFHILCLYFLAQYYDGTARVFYDSFLFSGRSNPIPHNPLIDFSPILSSTISHILRAPDLSPSDFASFLARFHDRGNLGPPLLRLPQLGDPSYSIWACPRGSESGVVHLLVQSRERERPFLFLFNSIDRVSFGVMVTAGQPFLINSILSREFSTPESVTAKSSKIRAPIDDLKIGQFQIDWAIATVSGIVRLIVCRPPQFLAISDNSSAVYNSAELAFSNARIVMACYRHTEFLSKRRLAVRDSSPDSVFHSPPIEGDALWCSFLKQSMDVWRTEKVPFVTYFAKCLQIPGFYFVHVGVSNAVSAAVSIFLDMPANTDAAAGIISQHILPGAHAEHFQTEFTEFARYCFWIRSLIRVLKAMVVGDLPRLQACLRGLFRVLPTRSTTVISFSVRMCAEAIRIFHPQRGRTEEFYAGVVRIYRFIFGDQFDTVMGIEKYDVPRPLRSQPVTIDTCSKQFPALPFKKEVQTVARVVVRFEKYFNDAVAVRGLAVPSELWHFKLDPVYVDFLKKVVIGDSVVL